MTLWVGIDPGLTGAIGFILDDGSVTVQDCPVLKERAKGKRDFDIHEMDKSLKLATAPCQVALEWPNWAGLLGKQATGSVARSTSIWETLCITNELAYHRIAPHKWKVAMGLKGKDKDASRALAMRLWPQLRDRLNLKKHDGRAEALLLAEYLRREL